MLGGFQVRTGLMLLKAVDGNSDYGVSPRQQLPVAVDYSGLARIQHPRRRNEWLAGRLCLSRAISLGWSEVATKGVIVAEELGNTQGGRPRFIVESKDRVYLSVSHSDGFAGGLVSECRCGLDIEPISYGALRAVKAVFEDAELELLGKTFGEPLNCWRGTAMWTLYEALSKAVGAPVLGRRLRIVAASKDPSADGWHQIRIATPSQFETKHCVPAGFESETTIYNDVAVSVVTTVDQEGLEIGKELNQ
ncbi:hypothetical protein GCM10009631_16000 [Corynebacterium glaucum]|uniref:4'-phosphopantetheinyl transferase family protein n=1 Tax=Corynebacterium glaucum TaxID=187491 RepID=UPI0031D4E616